MNRETPSISSSFFQGFIGSLVLLPSFIYWSLRVAARRIAHWDAETSRAMRNPSRYWRFWSRLGDGWAYAIVVLVLLRTGRVELAGHISACLILAWGGGAGLKLLFRRRRPHDELLQRLDPKFRPSLWSFPSQHAACAVAFMVALVGPASGHILGLVAFAVSEILASRLVLGSHYLSDVLAGIALGIAAGVWG